MVHFSNPPMSSPESHYGVKVKSIWQFSVAKSCESRISSILSIRICHEKSRQRQVKYRLTFAIPLGGRINFQGYDFICNFVKYGDRKFPCVTFPKNYSLSK